MSVTVHSSSKLSKNPSICSTSRSRALQNVTWWHFGEVPESITQAAPSFIKFVHHLPVQLGVYKGTWNLNTLKYGYGLSGSRAGLKKLETRLIKREGIRVLFRESVGGWGAGAKTHSTCPETQGQGSHYPLPALASMNLILKNKKRVREGEGVSVERSEGRQGGGWYLWEIHELSSVTITDRQGFISQLCSKDQD